MLLAILAWITLCTVALLGYYLWSVPEGPECPRCGGPGQTGRRGETSAATPAPLRDYLVEASCPACGWEGRLRNGTGPGIAMGENTECGRRP